MRVSSNRRPRGGRSNSGNGRSGSSGGRHGSNSNRRSGGGNRSYDSNGPDGKIRGSASQVNDKYTSLARDAQTSGDPVAAENFYQHAEHYFRIMLANNLVKQDKASDQAQTDENSPDAEDVDGDEGIEGADSVAVELNEDKQQDTSETKDVETEEPEEAQDKDTEEPIIIDLSEPESSVAEASVSEEVSEAPEQTDKPKTKRRVSRTRGLRRRTSRRSDDAENEEPQATE